MFASGSREQKKLVEKDFKKIDTSNSLRYGSAKFYETVVYLWSGGIEYNFHSKDTGLNMIMLQNYIDIDPLASEDQKKQGAYSIRGDDNLKSQMVIIENGVVIGTLFGTPEPSVTLGVGWDEQVEKNKYNSIAPGEYVIKGVERNGTWQMRIYEDSEHMMRDDRGGITSEMLGDNVIDGKKLKTGDKYKQSGLLIHDTSTKWSGSLGCSVLDGFDNWAKGYADSLKKWKNTFGHYYVVDYNRLQWKYHDDYIKKNK
ncbi:MAG: L,D-transpeptidase family protein [Patescibacteria group bacterium]|nr:L,D-transpeptidase family protein [Patescibacteria group bacterium]